MEQEAVKWGADYEAFKKDEEELFRLLAEGRKDVEEGRVCPIEEVFDEIFRKIENYKNGTVCRGDRPRSPVCE